MELILISGNKLKVILDADEARKYKIIDNDGIDLHCKGH